MSNEKTVNRVDVSDSETDALQPADAGCEDGCRDARPVEPEVDYFGGCPYCLKNDGFLNVGRNHWFLCRTHKTKWCMGSNQFACWRQETTEVWEQNHEELAACEDVKPAFDGGNLLASGPYTYRISPGEGSKIYEIVTATQGHRVAEVHVANDLEAQREHVQLFSSAPELLSTLRLARKCLAGLMDVDQGILARIHDVVLRAESRSKPLEISHADSESPKPETETIRYHEHLDEREFEWFASEYGSTWEKLQKETENAIRERLRNPVMMAEYDESGERPFAHTLALPGDGSFSVHFSLESKEVVVRGYSWDIGNREPLDSYDGGYICCDNAWIDRLPVDHPAPTSIANEHERRIETETRNVGRRSSAPPPSLNPAPGKLYWCVTCDSGSEPDAEYRAHGPYLTHEAACAFDDAVIYLCPANETSFGSFHAVDADEAIRLAKGNDSEGEED